MNIMKKNHLLIILLFFNFLSITAQNLNKNSFRIERSIIQKALNTQLKGFTESDLQQWDIQSDASSLDENTRYYYLIQQYNNIEVRKAITNLSVVNNVAHINNTRFVKNLASKINTTQPTITEQQAVVFALKNAGIDAKEVVLLNKENNNFIFKKVNGLQRNIKVSLVFEPANDTTVKLAWNVNLNMANGKHWWNIRIDATTGSFINKNDWVTTCFIGDNHEHVKETNGKQEGFDFILNSLKKSTTTALAGGYQVLPYHVESPNHGNFEYLTNPDDATASPNGWHDDVTNQYTTTVGNNVYASVDINGNDNGNVVNQSAAGNIYDYQYGGPFVMANTYSNAAATQLFYTNNVMHDILYKYGFDEASGNFQQNNFGNGGAANDRVQADAQDGSALNNANFSTPPDGDNGRMQMFLWSTPPPNSPVENLLVINNSAVVGQYATPKVRDNNFIPGHVSFTTPITANLVLAEDGTAPNVNDACQPITNTAAMSGKIAVIKRGNCSFSSKTLAAQTAGAVAVLIVNNQNASITMANGSGLTGITIPAYSIDKAEGDAILAEMAITTVNATLNPKHFYNFDGDFDNGVISHEYGHGLNIRLIGGRNNVDCVGEVESMGEGWSDFVANIIRLKNIDNGIQINGVGTFVMGQPTTGIGLRPFPYSGDITQNPMTYQSLIDDSAQAIYNVPHGVGAVWAGMLWDLTWDLIAVHGFNPNIYDTNGTEGNIVALKLVVEAFKLTACNPGFVDGRDAILEADDVLFGNGVAGSNTGANHCIIWGAFARRGLGINANQATVFSTSDGNSDFTNPATCAPNYLLTIGGATEVCEGGSLDFDIVFNAQNGWNTATGFVASGLPVGANAVFNPATISDTGLVTMTVTGLTPGNHNVVVTPGGDANKNLNLNLTVKPANPILTDGDTLFGIDAVTPVAFNNGDALEALPGANISFQLPNTAFTGTLVWTAPNGATFTTNTVNFTNIVDGDTAIEGNWKVDVNFTQDCGGPQTINFSFNINPNLSVSDYEFDGIRFYPNPTNGTLIINSLNNLNKATVSVYDVTGRILLNNIAKTHLNTNQIKVDLSTLATGSYFITVEDDTYKSTKQIIKN